MKNRRTKIVAEMVLCAVLALPLLFHVAGRPLHTLHERNEAAWIFSSYFYHLAFATGDLTGDAWQSFEAYDHPPVAKFILGAALTWAGVPVVNSAAKDFFHRYDHDWDHIERVNQSLHAMLQPRQLFVGRLVMLLFAWLTLLLVYLVAERIFGWEVGVAAAVLLSWNFLYRYQSISVGNDVIMLFFSLLALVLFLDLVRHLLQPAAVVPWIGMTVMALVVGVAIMTKLSAAVVLVVMEIALGLLWCKSRRWQLGMVFLLLPFLSLFFVLLVNPTLYSHPWAGLGRYAHQRLETAELQRSIFYFANLPDLPHRLGSFVDRLFFYYAYDHPGARWLPLGLGLFAAGVVQMRTMLADRKWRTGVMIFLLAAVLWLVAVVASYVLKWDRYLYPWLPWQAVLEGLGLVVIGRFFTTSQQRCWRTAATKIAAWALVIGLMVGVGWIWQVDRPLSEGLLRDRERELVRTKLLLDYHPHDQNAENF